MRIIDTYEVTLSGTVANYVKLDFPDMTTFDVKDDHGRIYHVNIPEWPHLVEAFQWMNDHDSLRHLLKLEPVLTTNLKDIQEVVERNTRKEENAYLLGNYTREFNYVTGEQMIHVHHLEATPTCKWTASWTFTSLAHAAAFKLAMKV